MDVEGGLGGRDFMDERDSVSVDDDRSRRMDDYSSALAEKLLQGWTLLNEHCPQCLTPLVRNRQKKLYCAACRQWILTESEAAARALQQRVERSDVAEQNKSNNSLEQTTSSSPTRGGGPVTPTSSGNQVNGAKSNGIGHLRLSLATLRAEEEKSQDVRNPKRFAPSTDHVQDGTPRLALIDGGEETNGNSNGIGRALAPSTFHRETPTPHHPNTAQVQSKSPLVLQPTVNPVNDILVARRTLTTLNEKLEGIRQLISTSQDVSELRQLFAVLEECIHAIGITRNLLKSVE